MHRYLLAAVTLFALEVAAYPITRKYGLYHRYWYTDVVLHVLAGVMLALFSLWFTRNMHVTERYKYFLAITFAVSASFVWELWEFYGHLLRPDLAAYYIPTLSDTLADIFFGGVGAVILCIFIRLYSRSRNI